MKMNSEKTVLQAAMAETESKLADMESKLATSEANFAESKLTGSESKFVDMESSLIESEAKFTDMESKLADSETKFADLESKLTGSESKFDQWKREMEKSKHLMTKQSISTNRMSTLLKTIRPTADRAKGTLLADSNREQQRRIETLKNAQESVAVFQQASKEKDEVIGGLEKKARDLLSKLRQAESQSDQATHRCLQIERECQELRDSVKELENHAFEKSNHSSWKQEMDPAKFAQRMKRIEFNLDITKQKSDKFEKLNKELKESNNEANEANVFKASNLEKQLEEAKDELQYCKTTIHELESEREHLRSTSEKNEKHFNDACQELEDELQSCKKELTTHQERLEEAKERVIMSDQKLLQLENEVEIEKKRHEEAQHDMKTVQAKCANMQSKLELQTKRIELLERHERELTKLCDEIQEQQEEEERQHKQTKARVKELEATLEEKKMLVDKSMLKKLQLDLWEKKKKIVTLESEILKCTDPLEKRIDQLTKELAESTEKVQSWKTEAKRLRQSSLAESNASSSRTEAGYVSGIIQEYTVFALKAEKTKLEVELKRSKAKANDLEKKYNEKCMFYQEEIITNTSLRAELKRYVEKSKVTKEQVFVKDGAQKRALNDVPRNSHVKKALKIHKSAVKESLPTSTSTSKTKADDLSNFLLPAIDKLNEDEPQQCAQQ